MEKDAEKCVENLFKLHEIKTEDLPAEVREKLNERKELQSFKGLSGDIFSMLDQDVNGTPFYEILQDRLKIKEKSGVGNLKEQIRELMEQCRKVVEMSGNEKEFLVHGDLAPGNTHVDKEGKVKFSRWDWATSSKNEALAFIYNFGNLRGRAAANPELQKALDKAIIDEFAKRGNSELGEAIVKMGTLRTSVKFLKYDAIKPEFGDKERSSMEKDVKKFFPEAGGNR